MQQAKLFRWTGTAFIKWGHIIRGWIYAVTGILTVQLALGWSDTGPSQTRAIYLFGTSWAGKFFIALIVLGLAGYAIWGGVRLRYAKNWITGVGFASSMLWYLALSWPAILLLITGKSGNTNFNVIGSFIINPIGRWLIIGAGVVLAAAGIFQVRAAVKGEELPEQMGEQLTNIARGGIAARGILIGLGGIFLAAGAWQIKPNYRVGYAQTLLTLYKWENGRYFVGILGIGLVALGIFSFNSSKYVRWPDEKNK